MSYSYSQEDFLMLSGLQHFAFCKRQWALIHIENQWAENYSTAHGNIVHKNAHDKNFKQYKNDILITRGMSVFSNNLGISGECDIVEFHKDNLGILLYGSKTKYIPYPIEYKSGKPKEHNADELQLCAQAICLEEMLCCNIPKGALYYDQIKRRKVINFTQDLKNDVIKYFEEMHLLHKKGHTPKVKAKKVCKSCSLSNICLPKIIKKQSILDYMSNSIEGDL